MTSSEPSRLDRIEAIVESNAKLIASNAKAIEAAAADRDVLRQAIVGMTEVANQTFAVIGEMQAEVRGLQAENRRILDRMFSGEQD